MSKLVKARVLRNDPVAPSVFNLVMENGSLAKLASPGQFLNIRVTGSTAPLLRRPISIHRIDGDKVEILFQVVGQGTELLARVRPGESLDVQGPLGRGFELKNQRAVLIGGGIGIAPLVSLAQKLSGPVLCLLGARNAEMLMACGGAGLESMGCEIKAATDDGSRGHKGLVTELLTEALPQDAVIYACGPNPMLKAVALYALEKNITCQVSMEEHMGCGVGACLGCVCKSKGKSGEPAYKRVCQDGPVFEAGEVNWQ